MVDKGERIFLLEVFVDNVHLENCKQDGKPMKTCVRFRLLNYPFLEIMEDEYCRVPDENCNVKFQSGKSCLFSLRKNPQGSKKPPLNLHVNVIRMESETKSVDAGKTVINLSGSFTSLLQTANLKQDDGSPVSKIIKETYVLTDDKMHTVGDITIFVRLSCFGKIIVTQFQMSGLESKSFLFKAVSDIRGKQYEGSGDAASVFNSSFPPSPSRQQSGLRRGESMFSNATSKQSMAPNFSQPGMSFGNMGPGIGYQGMPMGPGGMPVGGIMGQPGMYGPQPGMGFAGPSPPGWNIPGGMMPGMPPQATSIAPPMSLKPFGDLGLSAKDGGLDYKNFSATVNGHVLNIKVLRKPKKLKQTQAVFCQNLPCDEPSSSDESEDEKKKQKREKSPPCPQACSPCPPSCSPNPTASSPCPPGCTPCPPACSQPPRLPLCDCDIPIPPCLVCPPPPPPPPPKKKKKKRTPCPKDAGMYCKPGCPLGFPTPPGLIPPNYDMPAPMGASQTAAGEQQNFLISMEPRTEFFPMMLPPKPTCVTVRDTQYEQGDFGFSEKKKGSKSPGGKKGKGGKGKKK